MLASPIEEKLQEKQKAESDLSLFRNRMIKLWETNRVSMHYIPPFNNSYIQSANIHLTTLTCQILKRLWGYIDDMVLFFKTLWSGTEFH